MHVPPSKVHDPSEAEGSSYQQQSQLYDQMTAQCQYFQCDQYFSPSQSHRQPVHFDRRTILSQNRMNQEVDRDHS